jgi:RNA polymerase sigma factor (TIGR02999 family)
MASAKMAHEKPGHTLQPTALVNEAFLRLVGGNVGAKWENRRHFFCAAAEAMRRILVDNARRRRVRRREAQLQAAASPLQSDHIDFLAVHEVLDELELLQKDAAELVKLRFFAGFSLEESAEVLGLPLRTAQRRWSLAKAWLFKRLSADGDSAKKVAVGG